MLHFGAKSNNLQLDYWHLFGFLRIFPAMSQSRQLRRNLFINCLDDSDVFRALFPSSRSAVIVERTTNAFSKLLAVPMLEILMNTTLAKASGNFEPA